MITNRTLYPLLIGLLLTGLLFGCSRPATDTAPHPAAVPTQEEAERPSPESETPTSEGRAAEEPTSAALPAVEEIAKPVVPSDLKASPPKQPRAVAAAPAKQKPQDAPAVPPSEKLAPKKATTTVSPAPPKEKPELAKEFPPKQSSPEAATAKAPAPPEKKPAATLSSPARKEEKAASTRVPSAKQQENPLTTESTPAKLPAKPAPAAASAADKTSEKAGLVVLGEVVAASHVPEPGTVPYTECLTFIKYKVVSVESGKYAESELLAVHWGMKDHKLTPAARYQVGEKHQLKLEPFSNHPELARVMQADDTNEYTLTPYWAR